MVFRVDPGVSTGSQAKVALSIAGGVFPAWPGLRSTELRTGDTVPMTFGLVDDQGHPVDPGSLKGTGTLTAELVPPGGGNPLNIGSTGDVRGISTSSSGPICPVSRSVGLSCGSHWS